MKLLCLSFFEFLFLFSYSFFITIFHIIIKWNGFNHYIRFIDQSSNGKKRDVICFFFYKTNPTKSKKERVYNFKDSLGIPFERCFVVKVIKNYYIFYWLLHHAFGEQV